MRLSSGGFGVPAWEAAGAGAGAGGSLLCAAIGATLNRHTMAVWRRTMLIDRWWVGVAGYTQSQAIFMELSVNKNCGVDVDTTLAIWYTTCCSL